MPFQKGNRFGGKRDRKSTSHTPTKRLRRDEEDDEMVDGDGEGEEEERIIMEDEDVEDGEEAGTPAQDDDEDEDEDEDASPQITQLPSRRRGRGRGRPAGSRRTTRGDQINYAIGTPQPVELDAEEGSESGTPFRKGRRGGYRPKGSGRGGGFRGRRKGQVPEPARQVIDKDGQALDVVDDEVQVDFDEEGNEKVDEMGNLHGDREYRVRTFKIMGKGDRLYMLSTEPARCCGFRDSYLFFAKHPKLFKVLIGEDEKKDLIDRDILPSSYKGRNIGVVTARSVFREFGARIIVGGKKITDDYKVAEAKANGEVEGELADPDDRIPDDKADYNRNRYVAWFGASEVYRNVGQSTQASKPGGPTSKRGRGLTVENWQVMHAKEASRFNTSLAFARRANLNGVYDTHTNMMFYPKIMQPTHARWEQIPPPTAQANSAPITNGYTNGHSLANGTTETDKDGDDLMEIQAVTRTQPIAEPTIFTDVPAIVSRNFTVIDTHFEAPPISSAGYPGPDGIITDPTSGPNGLSSVPDDLLDELPEDCRRAFEDARRAEDSWKRQWRTEAHSGLRGALKIGFLGFPV